MSDPARPIHQAIVDQAVRATGAASGWLLAREGDGFLVLAANPAHQLIGRHVPAVGARAYALSSGQAAALMPQPGDPASEGAGGFPGVPVSLLTVPCPRWSGGSSSDRSNQGPNRSLDSDDDLVGILEVATKQGSRPFTVDDLGVAAMLATVAGAALAQQPDPVPDAVPPEHLAAGLARMAANDPVRYAGTARLIQAVLGLQT